LKNKERIEMGRKREFTGALMLALEVLVIWAVGWKILNLLFFPKNSPLSAAISAFLLLWALTLKERN